MTTWMVAFAFILGWPVGLACVIAAAILGLLSRSRLNFSSDGFTTCGHTSAPLPSGSSHAQNLVQAEIIDREPQSMQNILHAAVAILESPHHVADKLGHEVVGICVGHRFECLLLRSQLAGILGGHVAGVPHV